MLRSKSNTSAYCASEGALLLNVKKEEIMYKITCCRIGKWPKANRGKKGCFIREFETLYPFATFFPTRLAPLFFPCIHEEFTEQEIRWMSNRLNNYFRLKYKER